MITATTGESMDWSDSTTQNKLVWRIGHQEKIAKKLKNWEKPVVKEQIEQDKQFLMSCLRLRVNCWSRREGILRETAALERPTFPLNPPPFRVSEPSFAAILDCRTIHGILLALQETYWNDYLLKTDKTLFSSTIPRIWHLLVKNLDKILKELHRSRRVKWDEKRNIRRYLYHASEVEVDC